MNFKGVLVNVWKLALERRGDWFAAFSPFCKNSHFCRFQAPNVYQLACKIL
jgi:hypothetical protein